MYYKVKITESGLYNFRVYQANKKSVDEKDY